LICLVNKGTNPGDSVIAYGAYELRCDMYLIPTQDGPATIPQNSVVYLDAENSPVNINIKVDNIRFFDDMEDRGLRYDNMVAQFEEIVMQTRAQRAGLSVARNNAPKQTQGKILI
jgi:hypothetical protein